MTNFLHFPIPFGHWLVEGNILICRLPRKTVTVRAPKKLLLEVAQLCDGTMPWGEVLVKLSLRWDITVLGKFMEGLVADGVLVEASQLWAHWSDLAQWPRTTKVLAGANEISLLHQVAEKKLIAGRGLWTSDVATGQSPLAQLLLKRESTRTFDDSPISVECLHSVLWAAHGVARRGQKGETLGWRRTIASGGNMHSARWFVAILRELPADEPRTRPLKPDVYEVRFHQLGGASLQRAGGDLSRAWRCLLDPRVLRYASALVVPIYEVAGPSRKYGNRATLYALIEAGQALQNAQLMAFELGASCMLRGDTLADEALEMVNLCQGPLRWVVPPTIVIGAHPSPDQLKQQRTESVLKIFPNLRMPGGSFAFAATPTSSDPDRAFAASGRSLDPLLALTKAEAEGWERLAWVSPRDVEAARIADVNDAVDPPSLVAYSERQYLLEGFPCSPFSARRQYLWSKAIDVASGKSCSVLSDLVYANAALPKRFQKTAYTSASTSGMAAGTSYQSALCRATLELIERDAFVCAWLTRTGPTVLKIASLPQSSATRIADLSSAGFRIVVSNVGKGWVPVMSVFAQNDKMPLTVIATAADFSAEQALGKALDEVEGRIAHSKSFPLPDVDVTDPMRKIDRFYRSRRTYRRSDFYSNSSEVGKFQDTEGFSCKNWAELLSRLLSDEFRLLAVDMTLSGAAIEQGRVPLHVIRAFVPGLVPIWFQRGLQPEGMPRFSAPAGRFGGRSTSSFFVHPFT